MVEQLIFRPFTKADTPEIECFKADFLADGSSMDGTGTLFRDSAETWIGQIEKSAERSGENPLPCLQYGLFRDERLLGTLQIRLALIGYLVKFGGHIGYCVRPNERRKGYARRMLQMALPICCAEGVEQVLITCLDSNVGSARTIESCGGVLESIVYDDVNYRADMRRYWISL